MMRVGLLVTLVITSALAACQLTTPPSPGDQTTEPPLEPSSGSGDPAVRPFIWRVTRADSDSTSHVLGTLAIGDISARQLPRSTFELIATCRTFMVKMNVSDLSEDEMLELARYPEGESLKTALSAKQWKELRRATRDQIPDRILSRLRAWFVLPNVHASLVPRSSSASQPMGVELLLDARRRGKRIVGLEGWKAQVESVRDVYTVEVLRDTLDRLEEVRARLEAQVRAYRTGNVRQLESIIFDPREVKRHPRLFEELIFKRNRAWIETLEKHLTSGGAFVALGLEHLLGPRGVIGELRERGWVVERVD